VGLSTELASREVGAVSDGQPNGMNEFSVFLGIDLEEATRFGKCSGGA
jgi:hypothetical protein